MQHSIADALIKSKQAHNTSFNLVGKYIKYCNSFRYFLWFEDSDEGIVQSAQKEAALVGGYGSNEANVFPICVVVRSSNFA